MGLIGRINSEYVDISNRMTSAYERKMYFLCDLYFPETEVSPDVYGTYHETNIFGPHQMPDYPEKPSIENAKFYIPHLLRRENVNSPEDQFDAFYADESGNRPYIETSKRRELPLMTKVVVKIEKSKMYLFVDRKIAVNGANGHMLIRQYLSPLAEG